MDNKIKVIKFLKNTIRELIELLGILTLIIIVWQKLELIILGEIKSNTVDSIIAIFMTLLLHYEYKKLIRKLD